MTPGSKNPVRLCRRALTVIGALALSALPALHAPVDAAPPRSSETRDSPFETRDPANLDAVMRALEAWRFTDADSIVAAMDRGPDRELAASMLAIYRADYAAAESRLAGLAAAEASAAPEGATVIDPRTQHWLALARGAQVALGDAVTLRSDDGRFEAVFADPRDELLAPYLFEAMGAAYDTLGEVVGVRPDHPIRFEIYDDPGKLALVTPLTLDNIYTTGTVGICKYRRIMMISPRVMLYGYGWLDTAVHEYVHYLVTLRTGNEAPVWMQEGLAKLLEARWRLNQSPPLEPAQRALLHKALVNDELVTLEQMHPSVAMLPSQELAALAYAEAETMLGLLEDQRGREGLWMLMDQVAANGDAKQALAAAWGSDFDSFLATWKSTMRRRTAGAGSGGPLDRLEFRDGDAPEDPSLLGDVFSHLGGGRARQHARLGVLLTVRGHDAAAVIEYEKARRADPKVRDDPKLARRLGELYLKLERPSEALPLLRLAARDEPDNANLAAAEGRAELQAGDPEAAQAALQRAVRINPFIPSLHCDLAELAQTPQAQAREASLCMR